MQDAFRPTMQKVILINASQKEAHWPPIFSFDILKLTYICVDIKNILFKKFNTFDNSNQHSRKTFS